MDTFGAALFYGSGDVFAERVQLGRVRLEHLPLRGPVAIVVRSSIPLICEFIAALGAFGQELAVAVMFFSSDPVRSEVVFWYFGATDGIHS